MQIDGHAVPKPIGSETVMLLEATKLVAKRELYVALAPGSLGSSDYNTSMWLASAFCGSCCKAIRLRSDHKEQREEMRCAGHLDDGRPSRGLCRRKRTCSVNCHLERIEIRGGIPPVRRQKIKCLRLIKASRGLDAEAASSPACEKGNTPMHSAAWWGHHELIKNLHGVDHTMVNAVDEDGATPMHLAAGNGQREAVEMLHQLDNAAIHAIASDGSSPIHHAAVGVYFEVIKVMLTLGANTEARNKDGMTPLDSARQLGRPAAVGLLQEVEHAYRNATRFWLQHVGREIPTAKRRGTSALGYRPHLENVLMSYF